MKVFTPIVLAAIATVVLQSHIAHAQSKFPRRQLPTDLPTAVARHVPGLYDRSAVARANALVELRKLGVQSEAVLPAVIGLLDDHNDIVRLRWTELGDGATRTLAFSFGHSYRTSVADLARSVIRQLAETAVAPLADVLSRNEFRPLHVGVMTALYHIGSPLALGVVAKQSDHRDAGVRGIAIRAAWRLGDTTGVEARLASAVIDQNLVVRWQTLPLLYEIRNPRKVADEIASSITSTDRDVLERVANALSWLGDSRALDALASWMSLVPADRRRPAISVLERMHPDPRVSQLRAMASVRQPNPQPTADTIAQVVRSSSHSAESAHRLAETGDPRAANTLVGYLTKYLEPTKRPERINSVGVLLGSGIDSTFVLAHAWIGALWTLKVPGTEQLLIAATRKAGQEKLQARREEEEWGFQSDKLSELLRTLDALPPSMQARADADFVAFLTMLLRDVVPPELTKSPPTLDSGRTRAEDPLDFADGNARWIIVKLLGWRASDARAREALTRAARDPNPLVRVHAAHGLAATGLFAVEPTLVAVASDASDIVRAAAAGNLAIDTTAVRALAVALRDRQVLVRSAAAFAMAELTAFYCGERLLQEYCWRQR